MKTLDITEAARLWGLSHPRLIADTPGSLVFRVRDGEDCARVVKLLKPRGLAERAGMDYLAWRGGLGAVRLLERRANACLLEDAGTQALEDIRATDGEQAATAIVADLLGQLHSPSACPLPKALTPLDRHFAALFSDRPPLPERSRNDVAWATGIARNLLADQTHVMPLHGDLHHENILADSTGHWRAIDPHGLIGDPAYDAANMFGNPLGRPDITCDPERIALMAEGLAPVMGCDAVKLLRYAAAHAALSACWSIGDPVSEKDLGDAGDRLAFLAVVRGMLG